MFPLSIVWSKASMVTAATATGMPTVDQSCC